uniref:Uncharacterized protein n=1 Tax=Naja naja TaxID=35670 RepID=A0A8C6XY35_NAJNA
MATRVLSMSARLGPEEPVFAQLKPVLGDPMRNGEIFDPAAASLAPNPRAQKVPAGQCLGGGSVLHQW